jgi:hypothetical protein
MLLTFSGITFLHLNAIHYRSIVWMPWMMAGVVGLVRREHVRRNWLILLGATIACGTAGNVQEFASDVFATCTIGGCEVAALQGASRRRAILLPVTALTFGCLVASAAFLPFFVAKAQGWIYIPSGIHRSTQRYDLGYLLSWLIPKVLGPYPYMFLQNGPYHPHPDYSLTGSMLLMLGSVAGWTAWRSGSKHTAWMCLGPIAVIVIGLAKVLHIPIFSFITAVPFLRDVWFVKYHSYLFALAAIPSAIGLERVLSVGDSRHRAIVRAGIGLTCGALVLAIVYLWLTPYYAIDWNAPERMLGDVLQKWVVTFVVFVSFGAVLYFRPRYDRALLLALVTVQCMVMLPRGNAKRRPVYQPGHYASATLPNRRLMVSDAPNSNLLFNRESFAVTDSVLNKHYRDLMLGFFNVANAGAMLQPLLKAPINDTQALCLRVAGVQRVIGYPFDTKMIDGGAVSDPLPRAFLVSPATFDGLRATPIQPGNITSVLNTLERDLKTLPQPTNIRVVNETVQLDLPAQTADAVLVLNQAYSPGWKLNGRTPALMADLWPAWAVPAGSGSSAAAVYWPPGLNIGFAVSAFGAASAGTFFLLMVRKEIHV